MALQLSPAERARAVVQWLSKDLGITQGQIGKDLGYTKKSSLSHIINGIKPVNHRFVEKLCQYDARINPAFLEGYSDDMLVAGQEQPSFPEQAYRAPEQQGGVYVPAELVKMISDMSAIMRSQQETIRNQQETISSIVRSGAQEKRNIG